jgi:DNA-binding transcriptional LysR family regulator
VFAVASHHPLAQLAEPLHSNDIIQYRAVAAADSSRNLAPRTSGILSGQDILTVPDMQTKLEAQLLGLGVGYLPIKLAQRYMISGELIIKSVSEPKTIAPTYIAWRQQPPAEMGKAQQWLIKEIAQLSLDDLLM